MEKTFAISVLNFKVLFESDIPFKIFSVSKSGKYLVCAVKQILVIHNIVNRRSRVYPYPFELSVVIFHPQDLYIVSGDVEGRICYWHCFDDSSQDAWQSGDKNKLSHESISIGRSVQRNQSYVENGVQTTLDSNKSSDRQHAKRFSLRAEGIELDTDSLMGLNLNSENQSVPLNWIVTGTAIQHWHSHAVTTLAFSCDGTYLVSGGEEGVLVFWHQREDFRHFVPRLDGPIVSIVTPETASTTKMKLGNTNSDSDWKDISRSIAAVCILDNSIHFIDVNSSDTIQIIRGVFHHFYIGNKINDRLLNNNPDLPRISILGSDVVLNQWSFRSHKFATFLGRRKWRRRLSGLPQLHKSLDKGVESTDANNSNSETLSTNDGALRNVVGTSDAESVPDSDFPPSFICLGGAKCSFPSQACAKLQIYDIENDRHVANEMIQQRHYTNRMDDSSGMQWSVQEICLSHCRKYLVVSEMRRSISCSFPSIERAAAGTRSSINHVRFDGTSAGISEMTKDSVADGKTAVAYPSENVNSKRQKLDVRKEETGNQPRDSLESNHESLHCMKFWDVDYSDRPVRPNRISGSENEQRKTFHFKLVHVIDQCHTADVVCILHHSSSPATFVSASKDGKWKVWRRTTLGSRDYYFCVRTGEYKSRPIYHGALSNDATLLALSTGSCIQMFNSTCFTEEIPTPFFSSVSQSDKVADYKNCSLLLYSLLMPNNAESISCESGNLTLMPDCFHVDFHECQSNAVLIGMSKQFIAMWNLLHIRGGFPMLSHLLEAPGMSFWSHLFIEPENGFFLTAISEALQPAETKIFLDKRQQSIHVWKFLGETDSKNKGSMTINYVPLVQDQQLSHSHYIVSGCFQPFHPSLDESAKLVLITDKCELKVIDVFGDGVASNRVTESLIIYQKLEKETEFSMTKDRLVSDNFKPLPAPDSILAQSDWRSRQPWSYAGNTAVFSKHLKNVFGDDKPSHLAPSPTALFDSLMNMISSEQ